MVVSAITKLIEINYKALFFIGAIGWYLTGLRNNKPYGEGFDTRRFIAFFSPRVKLFSLVKTNIDDTLLKINELATKVNQFRTTLTNTINTINIDTLFSIDPQFQLFDRPSFTTNWLTPYTYEPFDSAIAEINEGVNSGIKTGLNTILTPPRIGAEFLFELMKKPLATVKLPDEISKSLDAFQTQITSILTDLAFNWTKYDSVVQGLSLFSNTSWVTIMFISFIPFLLLSLIYISAGTQLGLVYSGISNTIYSFLTSFLESDHLNSKLLVK